MSRLLVPQDRDWPEEMRRGPVPGAIRDTIKRHVFGTFTWNPPNLLANTTTDTTLTSTTIDALTDLRQGMVAFVSPPSALNTGVVVGGAWCPADAQLTIRLGNLTAGAIDPASGTWAFFAFQT